VDQVKAVLIQFLKSKTFKALVGVIAAALTAYAATGCGVTGPKHPSVGVLECKVAVLAPYIADGVEDVVHQIDGNKSFDPGLFLLNQGLTPDEIQRVAQAYVNCQPNQVR
jgi:hypothetical protein